MTTRLFIMVLLGCLPAVFAQNPMLELKGKSDFHSLTNTKGNNIDARILYVGESWVYLQRGFKTPQRVGLAQLDDPSRNLLKRWKDVYSQTLSADELKQIVELAETASKGQPLFVDPDPAKKWKPNPAFSDEFTSRKINHKRWTEKLRPWGDRAWRKDNVWQKKGTLYIQAKYDPHKDHKGREFFYTTGILQSVNKTTYGYFEARIKGCSRFPGLCPGFWLYSNGKDRNPAYPMVTYSEIDIVEMLQGGYDPVLKKETGPNHIDCNLHTREIINGVETWRRPQHWPEVCRNSYEAPWNPADDFHVYACENTPEKITWYIDGIKVAESPNHNWHLPMNLTLTLEPRPPLIAWSGVDGREPVPQASTREGFPTHMEVDYVRSWTLAD